jgi:IS605 OrfB family transposase
MQATVCGKVKDESLYPALDATAELINRVERLYFKERFIKQGDRNELKRLFLKEHGITGRQLNGIIFNLSGKVEANKKSLGRNLDTKERNLIKVNKRIKSALESKEKNWFKIHQFKRQAAQLKHKIADLKESIKSGVPSICFGSRKLFRKQFHLKDNGYSSHAEWLKDWQDTRSSQFYCLGSKDEKFGNQTCQLLPKGLKLRLTDSLAEKFSTHIMVPVVFPHGEEIVKNALLSGQAISYLFVRKKKGWYVHATTEGVNVPVVTERASGALGLDLNSDHIAVSRVDSYGNPTESWSISTLLLGKTKHQIEAILGDAIASVVQYAKNNLIPIVIEDLDLDKKKSGRNGKVNRKVSMMAYSAFRSLTLSKAFVEGVEVIGINPAYTSVIGWAKFGIGYRLPPHQAAAVAIARRGLGFRERLATRRLRYTFNLPARNRLKHVWSDWRVVSRMLARARKAASGSRQTSSSTRGIPLSQAAGQSAPASDGSSGFRGQPPDGSQQRCSAGECGCITISVPF